LNAPAKPAVIVVEDEPLLLLDDMCLFEEAGFEAVPAANAAEALTILEDRSDIKVVVTDISMPGAMDGLELCATIRDRWPPVDFILISGHAPPDPQVLPQRAVFLAKPVEVAALLKHLKAFMPPNAG